MAFAYGTRCRQQMQTCGKCHRSIEWFSLLFELKLSAAARTRSKMPIRWIWSTCSEFFYLDLVFILINRGGIFKRYNVVNVPWIWSFMKLFKTNNIDIVKAVNSTSISRCQAPCGENAPHYSILRSPVPRIFSVKLHRIPFKFVLAQ